MKKAKQFLSVLLTVLMLVTVVTVGNLGITANATSFTPRLTAPVRSGYYGTENNYNPFKTNTAAGNGNCTWYAWGRAFELLGSRPRLSTGDANTWYPYNANNGFYPYGSTPKLGAIACWRIGKYGHVAVVEAINGNGTITISESEWSAPNWWFRTNTINSNCSYYSGFQGFIYLLDDPTASQNSPDVLGSYIGLATDTGFRPCCEVKDASAVDHVKLAVWGTGDQSDLIWYDADKNSATTYFKDVPFQNHSQQAVEYFCDFYIYGINGSLHIESIRYQLFAPVISAVYFSNAVGTSFRPCCTVVANDAVRRVVLAVWSAEDQSDLKQYNTDYNGSGTYYKDVDMNAHATEASQYYCEFYVYGTNGKVSTSKKIYQAPTPKIINYYINPVTDTYFRPCCEVEDASKIDHVKLAVWTADNQSDLKWYSADKNSANTYFKDVVFSNFSDSAVKYCCEYHVYGTNGRRVCQSLIYCKHIWDTGAVTIPATCTEEGIKTYTCSACGDSYTETITELGHTEPNASGNCERCGIHLVDVPNVNVCPWCGSVHVGFFQSIISWFHGILAAIFGARY